MAIKRGDLSGRGKGNSRNGTSSKTVLTDDGKIEIAIPRDRAGSFEPQLIAKGQIRFTGFDDKILSLYARGMTVREIQAHLAELCAADVSPDLITGLGTPSSAKCEFRARAFDEKVESVMGDSHEGATQIQDPPLEQRGQSWNLEALFGPFARTAGRGNRSRSYPRC